MNKFAKRSLAVGASAAVLASAGVAYAFWTTTGTGTGSAATGTSSAVTLSGVADSTALTPGGPASIVTVTVTNPSTGYQKVTTVHLDSVAAYDTAAHATAGGATGLVATCGTADYAMPDIAANQNIPPSSAAATTALTQTGSLTMNNLGTSQDTCKSAFLRLALSST